MSGNRDLLPRYHVGEWAFSVAPETSVTPKAPSCLEVDVEFISPSGVRFVQPAFWAGESSWKVRWSSGEAGTWKFAAVTQGASFSGTVEVVESEEETNPLLRHGPVRIAEDYSYFVHADGKPFFYFADTWWLGMSSRLRFPDEFLELTRHRAGQGFTVVRLDAGLNTDCGHFDPRGANEGGQPWEEGYSALRPSFFDAGDRRIVALAEHGICPAIIGSWGHYLKGMGVERMKQHLRTCVARWNAFPVFWYMTIEYDMPFYGQEKGFDEAANVRGWMEVGRYFRRIDPLQRPVSVQSWTTLGSSRHNLPEPGLIDFDSLQLGSNDGFTVAEMRSKILEARQITPRMPVLAADQCYEGLNEGNWANIQVAAFWGAILSGSAGYTYGANGIWQFNREPHDFGPAPSGIGWGGPGWREAMNFPGAALIARSKQLLELYPFWRIEPHPEWFVDRGYGLPAFAGGIPDGPRFFYVPFGRHSAELCDLDQRITYQARWLDPMRFREYSLEPIQPGADGKAPCPVPPVRQPHVLILEPS